MKTAISAMVLLVVLCLLSAGASALETTVSQSGADSDEIMKGRTFTVEASSWAGECSQATISFDDCSSCSLSGESTVKTIGGGVTTVSWTTASATQSATAQMVSVTVSGGCDSESDDSDPFDIVLPPSLSLEADTGTSSLNAGSGFTANINIVNGGETTANDITIDVGGSSGISGTCSPISSIDEDQSAAESCSVSTSSSMTSGTKTVTFTASSTNADDASDSFTVYVSGTSGDTPGGSSSGGAPGDSETVTQTINVGIIAAGSEGKAGFTASGIYLTEVAVTPKVNSENVKVTATQTVFSPANVTAATGTVYVYLDIRLLNLRNENITSAKIKFKINKTWLATEGIANDEIILRRFNNNKWDDLETSVASSDASFVHYTATTPGFSVFAITTRTARICTPSEKMCSGNDLQQCSTDGMVWEVIKSCAGGCNSSILDCNPVSEGQGCSSGEKRCSGDMIQQCTADGSAWETLQTCEYGCDAATKTCNQLPAGALFVEGIAWWVWVIVVVVAIIIVLGTLFLIKK